jgi:hypothetical protein
MPLSDEDRTEIEAIIRKELVERERKAGMRWRTPLLVGGIVIPVALAYLVLKYGPPATLLDQADFGMVALGIGVVGDICNPRRDCPDWPRGSDLLQPAQYFHRSGPAVISPMQLSMWNRHLAPKRGTPPAARYSPVE